jgi:hypothetical protein
VTRSLIVLLALLVSGCSSMINSATRDMADNLNNAILNQDDLETVRQGAPAYLIMIDSFIQGSPQNLDLLTAGSTLYGAYAGAFVDEPDRARRLSEKSLQYAHDAFCIKRRDLCDIDTLRFPEFEAKMPALDLDDIDELYTWGVAWTGWIQARSDDWNAVANLPKAKAVMMRVVELDPTWDDGGAQLYLAVMNSLLPPSMGGKPDIARDHFERAVEMNQGRNLMVKTLYAQYYARVVFDQELHDSLLNEVIATDATQPGLTLINTLAQEEARKLLSESADFF